MRIGIVCPYSFDIPGGVQFHVRDLAEVFLGQGHDVSVLAPADEDTVLPDYVVSAGRAVPVRYNGSVARLNMGPVSAAKVSRWLERGSFDVLHLHEPITPSVSMLAMWAAEGPIVATFHTANLRSRIMQAAYPIVRSSLEKITGRIAVSEDARRTVVTHVGGDAVVIPNGVFVDRFDGAEPHPDWVGTAERPTVAFLGRMAESRKGMPVLAAALPEVLAEFPGLRVLVAGPGDPDDVVDDMTPQVAAACEFLGLVSDVDKARLLRSVDVYLAPNTGGESFGIILIEAMSARAAVLASDIPAFVRVLDGGEGGERGTAGATFRNEDPHDLAEQLLRLLRDPGARRGLAAAGRKRAAHFDWSVVSADIMAVYETVTDGASRVRPASDMTPRWAKILRVRGGAS
ncbi:glycosyltransferase family 4 protein [Lapillicoccus sp.]|uniref:glycosyltransferase family 4 protein n=1 Tax=Lapillicoccus sp. TaxID=1909287 RepID=UPI0025FC9605|nr:glycosyltransferase family 4 protein [Lapillicoccus sp.]